MKDEEATNVILSCWPKESNVFVLSRGTLRRWRKTQPRLAGGLVIVAKPAFSHGRWHWRLGHGGGLEGLFGGQTPENSDFQAIIIGWLCSAETLRGPQSNLLLKPQRGHLRRQLWWDLPQLTLCPCSFKVFWCIGHSKGSSRPCIPITSPAEPKLPLTTVLCPNCALLPGRDRREATVLAFLRAGLKPDFARMLYRKPGLNALGRGWEDCGAARRW